MAAVREGSGLENQRLHTHTTRRAQHAPIPANRLNAVPNTRPHSNAVPSTRPYLNAHRTPCPACARIHTPRSSPLPRPSVRQGSFPETLDLKSAWYDATASPLPARLYARGSFPETLDLKSTWYDATATEMLAAFVNRTRTAYPRASPPRRLVAPLPLPLLPPRRLLRLGSALLYPPLSLLEHMVMFPSGLSSVSLRCSLRLCCPFLFFYLIRNVWWRGF